MQPISSDPNVPQPPTGLTRRQRRQLRRQERRQGEAQDRSRRRRGKLLWYGILLLIFLGLGWFFVYAATRPTPPKEEIGETFEDEGRGHVSGTDHAPYKTVPPTSGPHSGNTVKWGYYDEEIQEEPQVHNLEHGGVILQYNCAKEPKLDDAACQQLADDLINAVKKYSSKIIVAPYAKLTESRIALTAWIHRMKLDTVDTALIEKFVDAYRNRGPERVPDEKVEDFREKSVQTEEH